MPEPGPTEEAASLVSAGKPIIGLAGGIGAGKSEVASVLGELGAWVIASDQLNHEELSAPEVLEELGRWWGEAIFGPGGRLDRSAVRAIISHDQDARKRLERLMYPRIARRREALMAEHQDDPAVRAFVWDSPLLYEAGLADRCDVVIFVEADRAVRQQRVSRKRGWTAPEFMQLEKLQDSLDFKRARADYKVVNNSDIGVLRRQVEDVFSRILSGA